ncbi:C40 family peptidase [Flavobacterium sp. LB3P122]|uniref:C40 family peptidase n=1 Tax=Flavobacterium algoriphilum TaxID=3398738 RepID=UPI003A8B776E
MKHLLYLLLILIFFTACKSTSVIIPSKNTEVNTERTRHLIAQLIHSASENLGVKYKSGGITKAGFDCSGLLYFVFNSYKIQLPHSSLEQSKLGLIIDRDNIKKGDLIFFKTNRKSQINHVGMVIDISDDNVKFIHSSTSRGVIISSTKEPYYQSSFAQVNRIIR